MSTTSMNIIQVADDAEREKAEKIGYTAAIDREQAQRIAATGGCKFLAETTEGWKAFKSGTDFEMWIRQE